MRLTPDQRHLLGDAVGRGINKTLVATVLGVTLKTVRKWSKRTKHLKDKARGKIKKVTDEIKLFIIAVRNTFDWGTARIRNSLMQSLPVFMEEKLVKLGVVRPEKVKLSRSTINDVLKEFGLNGYKKKRVGWKLKGPYRVQGQKFWWLVCVDDFSRVVICAEMFDHMPSHEEIWEALLPKMKDRKAESILTDNNPFRKEWDKLCEEHEIRSLHIHPYWPKDNGKVERMIKTLSEEFIYLLRKFPEWIGKLDEYIEWYNEKRYHYGINAVPIEEFNRYLMG